MDAEQEAKLREIIAEHLGVEVLDVRPEALLFDDLGADELDHVEMVMGLEEEFGIEFPDEEAEALKTVEDVRELVARKLIEAH